MNFKYFSQLHQVQRPLDQEVVHQAEQLHQEQVVLVLLDREKLLQQLQLEIAILAPALVACGDSTLMIHLVSKCMYLSILMKRNYHDKLMNSIKHIFHSGVLMLK